jgi:formylglycine-generating enzyme required for sulfatase activity
MVTPPASDGRGLLDRHRVRGAFHDLFAEFELGPGPAAEKAERVLTHLEHESGLLLPEGGDLYGLPHLSYEEYLTGCFLSRQADFLPRAYGHWQADPGRWREVIFLALGRMVRGEGREAAAGWLAFLLVPAHGERVRGDAERQRAAFFAYECLSEMGGKAALIGASTVALPELWTSLAAGLAQVVEGDVLPAADRVQAGTWLGELGDPRPGVCTLPPTMVPFAGGRFVLGLTPAEMKRLPKDEQSYFSRSANETSVPITAFELARYPVTNAQYALFIESDGYNPEAAWWEADPVGRQWLRGNRRKAPSYWDDERLGIARPNHPVVGVTWYEATAFCRWLKQDLNDGHEYVLPSEAEWEYAARGAARRVYPWPTGKLDSERANYNQEYIGTSAVGCFPAGATLEGVLDLAGNVWEWTRSAYRDYPYDPTDGREDGSDPAEKRFTLRGGSWNNQPIDLRASCREHSVPGHPRYLHVGFRLARHPRPRNH